MAEIMSALRMAVQGLLDRRGTPRHSRVWLAVSGGLDSMALLEAADGLPWDFGVLHVDHGLHPQAAEILAFVRERTAQKGWPFQEHAVQGLATSTERKSMGLEAAARAARYRWMAEAAGPKGVVLTAHHADDQRETRLLHLLRGSRTEALAAMSPWQLQWGFALGRPFLDIDKSMLKAALEQAKTPWREDPTNAAPDFLRNRIRGELIPLLDSIRPGWAHGLERMGAIATEWRQHTEALHSTLADDPMALPLTAVQQAPSALHLLGVWGAAFGFGPTQAAALCALAAPETEVGRRHASASHVVIRERHALVVQPLSVAQDRSPRNWDPTLAPANGSMDTPDGTLTWHISMATGHCAPDPGDLTADVALNALTMPLQLRTWTDGDRMAPLGMTGHQLVSDILTQRKVAAADRDGQWVLEDAAGQIVWLVGHRISRLAALPPSTTVAGEQPLLHLRWTPLK